MDTEEAGVDTTGKESESGKLLHKAKLLDGPDVITIATDEHDEDAKGQDRKDDAAPECRKIRGQKAKKRMKQDAQALLANVDDTEMVVEIIKSMRRQYGIRLHMPRIRRGKHLLRIA